MIDFLKWVFGRQSWKTTKQNIRQSRCPHTDWDMDNQIRVIRCCNCGKEAWVKNVKNLYPNKIIK